MNTPIPLRFGCCGSMISPGDDPVGIEIVESLAQFGYDYIELSLSALAALPETEFKDARKRIKNSGISCEACNNFYPATLPLTGDEARLPAALEYAKGAIERAADLGVRVIVFGSSGARNVPCGFLKDKAWGQIVRLLQSLGSMAAAHGITISIEPLNSRESNIINRAAEGLKLVREVNHPNIQLLIDYYHLTLEQENPGIILQAGNVVSHVHFASITGRSFPVAVVDGFSRFFNRLREINYTGRCSVEAYTRDFAAQAPRALRLLKKMCSSQRI